LLRKVFEIELACPRCGSPREVVSFLRGASNRRYLAFVSALEDPSPGMKPLEKLTENVREKGRTHRGFDFFDPEHLALFRALARGEFTISGFRNRHLRQLLPHWSCSKMARALKRLRLHGVIKKVRNSYKYYLTALGRRVVATGLKLREFIIIPSLVPATEG